MLSKASKVPSEAIVNIVMVTGDLYPGLRYTRSGTPVGTYTNLKSASPKESIHDPVSKSLISIYSNECFGTYLCCAIMINR